MPAVLEQSAAASVAKGQSRTATATFTKPTKAGSMVIVVAVGAGTLPSPMQGPTGFTALGGDRGLRDLQMSVWYRLACPSITSVSVTSLESDKSIQLRAIEYSGVAQSGALDKLVGSGTESQYASTGATGTLAQDDELVIAFCANQYASTSQYGFSGGLARLYETTSPSGWAKGSDEDWERSRLTVSQAMPTQKTSWSMANLLSTSRRWLTLLATFRVAGGFGPARMSATDLDEPMLDTSTGGRASLTVFGPLSARTGGPVVRTDGGLARIGPYVGQFRFGGWQGLLVGSDTPWRVEGINGLYGWELRTSDDDLPRGAGAVRGIDLQSARTVLFKLNADSGPGRDVVALERRLDSLWRALVPQRDTDWDLIWRPPGGGPLRLLRCRPTNLIREQDLLATILARQPVALRAADPRHYSTVVHRVRIPQTPLGEVPQTVTVINAGNGAASPLIRVLGPTSADLLRRVELVNRTQDVSFTVAAVVARGSQLIGDMEARATGAPRSVITIDEQAKYGAWQHPRTSFFLGPGGNDVYLRTDPPGIPIECWLEYRDTWDG